MCDAAVEQNRAAQEREHEHAYIYMYCVLYTVIHGAMHSTRELDFAYDF